MEWEVEKIVKSEIIPYTRKVRRVSKTFKELRYFVKWAGCSEDIRKKFFSGPRWS